MTHTSYPRIYILYQQHSYLAFIIIIAMQAVQGEGVSATTKENMTLIRPGLGVL